MKLRQWQRTLAQCVDHINQHNPKPDVVLVTGDITHSGQSEKFTHAAELLNPLKMPFYVIPGNHDDRDLLRSIRPDRNPIVTQRRLS